MKTILKVSSVQDGMSLHPIHCILILSKVSKRVHLNHGDNALVFGRVDVDNVDQVFPRFGLIWPTGWRQSLALGISQFGGTLEAIRFWRIHCSHYKLLSRTEMSLQILNAVLLEFCESKKLTLLFLTKLFPVSLDWAASIQVLMSIWIIVDYLHIPWRWYDSFFF